MGHAPEHVLRTYFRAKDGNRPDLMRKVFSEAAVLETVVKTPGISFPVLSQGLAPITDVLVQKFAQTYENIHSFYLERPPPEVHLTSFSCDWLVGMSEKESKNVKVGCGRYDWWFQAAEPRLADRLLITIEVMQIFPANCFDVLFQWLTSLPYPWCPAHTILETAPAICELDGVLSYVARQRSV
jgi:hypothetical protein